MQELKAEMYRAMMNEYKRAEKARGGPFHSTHEAYAVVLEEVEEAVTGIDEVCDWTDNVWMCTTKDFNPALAYKSMQETALNAAAECIQVAAMCRKALLSECCVEVDNE